MRQRIRAELELDDKRARQCLGRLAGGAGDRSVDAFDVERRAVARGHPEAAALPADVRVIDAAFEPLAAQPHAIGRSLLNTVNA